MTDPTAQPPDPDAPSEPSADASPPPEAKEEAPPTPFDHPLFLPVLLAAFSVWFGYDGYLNDDPDMQEHLAFNRFGLRVLAYLTAVVGFQGWRELKGRPPSPWVVPVMLGVMTAWSAYDGWLSRDPLILEYRPFLQHATLAWAAAALGFGLSAWLRQRGRAEPFFVLPLLLLGLSASFAWAADADDELLVAYVSSCGGLFAVALWLAVRRFRDRGGAALGP